MKMEKIHGFRVTRSSLENLRQIAEIRKDDFSVQILL